MTINNQLSLKIILLGFLISVLVSVYNLKNYDNFFIVDGKESHHKMIKYDAFRYLSHGAEIKENLKDGKSFFESGREHFTKYLPPRLAAAYYYFFDYELFNNFVDKKINLGIHFPYLFIQCAIYFISLYCLFIVLKKNFDEKVVFFYYSFFIIRTNYFSISCYFLV